MSERRTGKQSADIHIARKLQEQADRIAELEATIKRISEVEPIGDSGYKYGYAWERCVTIAVLALEGEAK